MTVRGFYVMIDTKLTSSKFSQVNAMLLVKSGGTDPSLNYVLSFA